ncbi:MAG TPA: type II toxin-antitoxin system RelE/ParE family toxin [Clostridia bacterium]|nr:type II toxin-antitoxin system RelE/ParE family toxin [Clostridia bacterium]
MATYRVELRGSADRELSRLDRQVVERMVQAIDALGEQPRPVGVRKLTGAEHTYRIRVGDYRVVYTIDDARKLVIVERVRHRSDAYR